VSSQLALSGFGDEPRRQDAGRDVYHAPRRPESWDELHEWAHARRQQHDRLAVHVRVLFSYASGLERDLKAADSDLRAARRTIAELERRLDTAPDCDAVVRLEGKLAAANMPLRVALAAFALAGLLITLSVVL